MSRRLMARYKRPRPLWVKVARATFNVIGCAALLAALVLLFIAAPHIDAWVINNR